MALVNVIDLRPKDKGKIIEAKVYRKWIGSNPPNATPTGFCCMLLDKSVYVTNKYRNSKPNQISDLPNCVCSSLTNIIFVIIQGYAIQANMDVNDIQYFDQLLEKASAYKISSFSCEQTRSWQQTLPNLTTLRFGRFTKFETIPNDEFPEHYFRFISYNQLFQRLAKNSILTGDIKTLLLSNFKT